MVGSLAAILFGDETPSGRLPFTMPRDETDLPAFDNVSVSVTYDYFHGYRHLANEGTAAEYPFGYGLGYTDFVLSGLSLGADVVAADGVIEATVRVDNVGAEAGRHTAQAYVAAVGSAIERAPEDLRAFAQIELDPGSGDTVTLSFPVRDVAYWDEGAGAFVVEPIEYEVRVGGWSGDPAAQTARFSVTP